MTTDTMSVFISSEKRPKLTAGRYTLAARVNDKVLIGSSETDKKLFQKNIDFDVNAPRFSLSSTEVQSVWPPEGHNGDFSTTLPHIVLQRPSLPWERELTHPKAGSCPWLALLCLSDSDFTGGKIPKPDVRTVAELLSPKPAVPGQAIVGPDITLSPANQAAPGETAAALCTTMDLERGLFRSVAPALDDLKFLSHVRKTSKDAESPGVEHAVILANRFPAAPESEREDGTFTHVFLISLEGHLSHLRDYAEKEKDAASEDEEKPEKKAEFLRLAVLHSWSFRATQAVFFKSHIDNLRVSAIGEALENQSSGDDKDDLIANARKLGFSAMDHNLRDGTKTVSWYRGPLIPYSLTPPALPKMHVTSDSALRYDPETGLFDISYAAAFQLGRLLALKDRHFSKSFVQWTVRYRKSHNKRPGGFRNLGDPSLPLAKAFAAARQTITQEDPQAEKEKDNRLPEDALSWLSKLSLLKGVPLNYLFPEECMLGDDEMRVFDLDPNWITALLAGACSLGRHRANDEFFDEYLAMSFKRMPKIGAGLDEATQVDWPLGGFVLRSSLVAAWNSLTINASGGGKPRVPLRVERIGPDILFCLYSGQLDMLEIKQPLAHSHFGSEDLVKHASAQRILNVNDYAESDAGITDSGTLANDIMAKSYSAKITIRQAKNGEAA